MNKDTPRIIADDIARHIGSDDPTYVGNVADEFAKRIAAIANDGDQFVKTFNDAAQDIYQTAVDKGWYDKPAEDGTRIALMHSELSEALEALRHGNPPDDKVPEFSGVEAELADVVIRIMDYSAANKLRIAEAIVAKAAMNKTRTKMHGGKRF